MVANSTGLSGTPWYHHSSYRVVVNYWFYYKKIQKLIGQLAILFSRYRDIITLLTYIRYLCYSLHSHYTRTSYFQGTLLTIERAKGSNIITSFSAIGRVNDLTLRQSKQNWSLNLSEIARTYLYFSQSECNTIFDNL